MSDHLVRRARAWPQSVAGDTMREMADCIDDLEKNLAVAVQALRDSRETHCGIAEHCLEKGKKVKTAPIFADSQRARLAIDAALLGLARGR